MTSTNINETFTQRKAGIGCPMCSESSDADVVATLPSGRVHFQDDADYRGYCILIFPRHVVDIHELTVEERAHWIEDIARIGKAVTEIFQPGKLNVAMLGNLVPHLHCHIMPRYPDDPEWGHPPAFRPPSDRNKLAPEEYARLRDALKQALAS